MALQGPLCTLPLLLLFTQVTWGNMNGDYLIGNPNGIPNPHAKTQYSTNFIAKGYKCFDVYTEEISTLYGQTYWILQPDLPLPKHITEEFDGKVIAITGYEIDQVRKGDSGQEISVPINWAYNHHYVAFLQGKLSELTRVPSRPNEHGYWGDSDGKKWMPKRVSSDPTPDSGIPVSAKFAEGNGGEYRKSYHGYPQGFAQLVESPTKLAMIPMQIDTWNRDNNSSKFVPGPVPKVSPAPPHATYSGLVECPCTDRISKKVVKSYSTRVLGTCAHTIDNANDCFDSAQNISNLPIGKHSVVSDASKVPGCHLATKDGEVSVIYNEPKGVTSGTQECGIPKHGQVIGEAVDAVTSVKVSLSLDKFSEEVVITMEGPAEAWFGVGFNASGMEAMPYVIIVSSYGGSVSVTERRIGDHDPGTEIGNSLKLISVSETEGRRMVKMRRKLQGMTRDHYTFDMELDTTLPLITAVGSSQKFGYHKVRGGTVLSLFNQNGWTCVCNAGIIGQICGNADGGCLTWFDAVSRYHRCPPQPTSDLWAFKNPTCRIESYQGGLACCHHHNRLLDKDQNPWPDQYLTYRLKWRFWYTDYVPATATHAASHQNLVRFYWQTEAFAGEYDVPKGSLMNPGTTKEGDEYIYTITGTWSVGDMLKNCSLREDPTCTGNYTDAIGIQLILAGGHCHAPSCISIELYNHDTGKLLCRQLPVYGKGHTDKDKFDEYGYLILPPCVWGDDEGLAPRETLSLGTRITSVKRNNATHEHFGEMASWQMRGIVVRG